MADKCANRSQSAIMLLLSLNIFATTIIEAAGTEIVRFTQRLDHFGSVEKNVPETFEQFAYVNDENWGGANKNAPIFVFMGRQPSEISDYYLDVKDLSESALKRFKAMIVIIEHRFYDKSIPLGSIESAMANKYVRSRLTVEQALEDFKEIILTLKSNYSAQRSPVVIFGGGYPGVLATYMRLKYPEIVNGSVASSAPILLYGTIGQGDRYCDVVSQDFEDISLTCNKYISQSWKKMDEIAARPKGLQNLSRMFNRCSPFKTVEEPKQLLASLYSFAAVDDNRTEQQISRVCSFVNKAKGEIDGMVNAFLDTFASQKDCLDNYIILIPSPFEHGSNVAWDWQQCKELVALFGCKESSMFPPYPLNMSQFLMSCQKRFGVVPSINSLAIQFGLKDVEDTLRKFGSNMIFSNGLRDPISTGGLMVNISETIIAITTTEGTNQMDLDFNLDDSPEWLKRQIKAELGIISHWVYQDQTINKGFTIAASNILIYFVLITIFYYHILLTDY